MLCFMCSKVLQVIEECRNDTSPNLAIVPPADATRWNAYGNFGSRIWDPCDGKSFLSIAICDECLLTHADRALVVRSEDNSDAVVIETSFRRFIEKFRHQEPDAPSGSPQMGHP